MSLAAAGGILQPSVRRRHHSYLARSDAAAARMTCHAAGLRLRSTMLSTYRGTHMCVQWVLAKQRVCQP